MENTRVTLHRFGVAGGEGIISALADAGVETISSPASSDSALHIVLFRDPFELLLRRLFENWQSLSPADAPSLAVAEAPSVAAILEARVPPRAIAVPVTQLMEKLGVELVPTELVSLRQQGAQLFERPEHRTVLVRADGDLEHVHKSLSALVDRELRPIEFIDAPLPGPAQRQIRGVAQQKLKARYVTEVITQQWVQAVFTIGMGERIRKRWERIDIPQYTVTWTDENFGQELPASELKSGRKVFAAEGGFEHFSTNRTNIAISKFWHSETTDPDDLWNADSQRTAGADNKEFLADGDTEAVVDVGDFSPNKDVLIHDIRVKVRDMPLDKYRFFLGDNCIYVEESPIALESLGLERSLPHAGEIHCTAISVWDDGASYERSIGIPDDCPLLLTSREQIRIPTCFSRHRPHSLDAEDFSDARVRIEIEFSELDSGFAPHKFIRIPYLDQYPDADKLILPNRPWYQAWDGQEPLEVKGFAVYFSPKAAIQQDIRNIAIYAVDASGEPVPGKRIELPDQFAGGVGFESVSLSPSFVNGHIRIEPGEYLSASGILADGTPSADCALFVLVEIPEAKVPGMFTNPLFRSNGVANLEYLRECYNADRIISRPTPAGVGALEAVATSDLEPWKSELGYDELPEDETARDEVLEKTTKFLFID